MSRRTDPLDAQANREATPATPSHLSRSDTEIADEVREVLDPLLLVDPGWATVSAHDGAVTLTGQAASEETRLTALQLASEVDGVTHVIDHTTVASPPRRLDNED